MIIKRYFIVFVVNFKNSYINGRKMDIRVNFNLNKISFRGDNKIFVNICKNIILNEDGW